METEMTCSACDAQNAADAEFCRSCGAKIARDEPGADVGAVPLPLQSEGLAWKWIFLGVLIIFGSGIGLGFVTGFVLALAGIVPPPPTLLMVVGVLAFGLGGFIVGKRSPGKTIIEPGISAFIATAITLLVQGNFSLFTLVVGGLLPFGAACVGAWLGEKAQGTI